ncbi:hypothetical protein [Streptomyces sp. NPDC002851]
MEDPIGTVLPLLLIAIGFAAVLTGLWRLAVRVRRSGGSGSGVAAALAAHDEAWRGTAHAAYVEIQAEAERKTPLLSPDEKWAPSSSLGARRPGVPRRPGTPRSLRRRVRRRRLRRGG